MNTKIKNTNVEDLLFFDMECVRSQKELDVNSDEFVLFQYKNRNRETGELLPDTEVVELYKKTAALSPVYGKVVCATIGFLKGTTFHTKSFTGEEKDILTNLFETLNGERCANKAITGFNHIPFDLNYITLRAAACGVETTLRESANPLGKKEWNMTDKNLDLMLLLKGTGFYNLSLNEVAFLLGVKSPKDDIDGSQVSDVFYSEGVDRIAKYCAKDVQCVAEIFLALQGKKNFITEVVDKSDAPMEKTSILKAIGISKSITEKQQEFLLQSCVKDTKKNKKELAIILKGLLADEAKNYVEFLKSVEK